MFHNFGRKMLIGVDQWRRLMERRQEFIARGLMNIPPLWQTQYICCIRPTQPLRLYSAHSTGRLYSAHSTARLYSTHSTAQHVCIVPTARLYSANSTGRLYSNHSTGRLYSARSTAQHVCIRAIL
jgi:hypothetical protein